MDTEITKTYPGFGSLVSRIKEKLSDEGASPNIHKAFIQAQRNLTKARSEYITNKILYSELQEISTDLAVRGQENTLNSEENKLKDILSKSLAYAELFDYLHFNPSATSNSTLFGITEDDLVRHNPTNKHLSELMQVMIPKVEARLLQKCEDLYAYFDPSNSLIPASEGAHTTKALSLPAHVEERKSALVREKTHLQQTRQQRDKHFWSYFQKLLECLSTMETLIKNFKCGSQAETDTIAVEHLRALCKVTCLKVRSANLHVLCDTYTVESVKALKAVSGHLETVTSQAKRELSATNQSLHAFRRLGPEFTALAEQVTQLQRELCNKKWGLEKFGQNPKAQDADGTSAAAAVGSAKTFIVSGDDNEKLGNVASSTDSFHAISEARSSRERPISARESRNQRKVEDYVDGNKRYTSADATFDVLTSAENSSISSLSLEAKSQHGKRVTFQ